MNIDKEYEILEDFVQKHNLKHSEKRIQILNVVLDNGGHFTIDCLYRLVRKKFIGIGQATVYRTVRVFLEAGLLKEIKFEDGVSRYELNHENEHHHHLVCIKCQKLIEIKSMKIEDLQNNIAKEHGFKLINHSFELFGICADCMSE